VSATGGHDDGLVPVVLTSVTVFVVLSLAIGLGVPWWTGALAGGATAQAGPPEQGPAGPPGVVVDPDEADQAAEAAGCEVRTDGVPLEDRHHVARDDAPDLDELYTDGRPTHSGPHTAELHPLIPGGADRQLDELSLTHNLEHGAVVLWYDPAQVDADTVAELERYAQGRNEAGFAFERTGAAVFVSPYVAPGISSGAAVALRAWGTAIDCQRWSPTVADAFLASSFGSRGIAPEGHLAPYPEHVLDLDRDLDDR
jgi:hypothetical protein